MSTARTLYMRNYMRKYRENNREKLNLYRREWNANNKDKVKANIERYWNKKDAELCSENKGV